MDISEVLTCMATKPEIDNSVPDSKVSTAFLLTTTDRVWRFVAMGRADSKYWVDTCAIHLMCCALTQDRFTNLMKIVYPEGWAMDKSVRQRSLGFLTSCRQKSRRRKHWQFERGEKKKKCTILLAMRN